MKASGLILIAFALNSTSAHSVDFSAGEFPNGGDPVQSSSSTPDSVQAFSKHIFEISGGASVLHYKSSSDTTRGSAEVSLFKKASNGTVFIATEDGFGSGALITNNGYIVTNEHVIGNATEVAVYFKPIGTEFNEDNMKPVRGIVEKVSQKNDLALVKVEQVPNSAQPIPMLNANFPEVGEDAHAIGHPAGNLWTYTRGYVSQVRPNHKWSYGENDSQREASIIQTQTPINPGNSGGPLVNSNGELIGLNSFGKPDFPGLNYAVSTKTIQEFLKSDREAVKRDTGARTSEKPRDNGANVKCGDEVVQEVRDYHKNVGNYTRFDYDPDCVGRITFQISIPDDETKPIFVFIEHKTKQGVIGTMLLDYDRDGQADYTKVDVDGDGTMDFEGNNKPGENIAGTLTRIVN